MKVGIIIGSIIVLGMVGILFVLALTPQPTSNDSIIFPANQVEEQIKEREIIVDEETLKKEQNELDLGNAEQFPISADEPLDVQFEALCNTSFYNPFDEKKVDFENTMENGYCFPLNYLEIFSCDHRIIDPDEPPELTICDADIVYPQPNFDESMGVITDANGVAFVNMECLLTENWAWCKDNIIIDPYGNLLAFLGF